MKRVHLLIMQIILHLILGMTVSAENLPEYTIRKLSVSGIFTGKDRYKKLYRLSKGSAFKQDEHDDGVRSIEKHLKRLGYLIAHVTTHIDWDHSRHTVDVKLSIATGPLFTIRQVTCRLRNSILSFDNVEDIFKKLQRRLESRLKNAYCSQDLLDSQARMIAAYFEKKGYLFPSLEMEQLRYDESKVVDVIFNCSLNDKKKFIFVGNSFFTSQHLYQACAAFGKALPILPPELIVAELIDLYHKQGYLDVAIDYDDEPLTILFAINEGSRALIERISIKGLDDSGIQKDIFFKSIVSSQYDHEKMAHALSDFTVNLIKQGYWKAKIQKTHMRKLSSGNYEYALTVDLGEQLSIKKITGQDFEGLLTLLYRQNWCKEYAAYYKEQPEAPLIVDFMLIGRMKKFLQKKLHERGYLYTRVTPQFGIVEGKNILTWDFSDNQKVIFGDTAIKGSFFLPHQVIERVVLYKKGDPWNKKKLDETASALRSFGVFDQVTVFPENIALQEQEKKIIIQLQDSDPFEVRARAGFQGVGTNFTWRGGATYKFGGTFLWKNPRKSADIFSAQFDINRFLRYLTLMYQLPFFGNLPIKQIYKVYSNWYEQPVVLGSREILYRYAQNGFLFGLSQDISRFKWGVTSGIDWLKISDISDLLAQAIDFTARFVDKYIPYFFCEPSLYVSDVDNRLDPLEGWYLVLSSKAFAPLGVRDAAFIKFLLEQGNYIPVHKATHAVLAIRLRLGTIVYQQFSAIVPPERFYLGGAYSLRGYEPDLAPPLNFYTNGKQELIVVPTGGKTMMNGNFELRFTIFRSLGGTVFTDIGILTQNAITDIHVQDIIGASGFGLRWNTPVGPLRFDIGWKWKKFPGNTNYYDQASYAWFLTLGNAF
ncbi:MAG: BamA/TamA family outer membrane protein [Candidatus Babeliaceae bacterium]|nr:BamA/TamA family outer membrane protein [Candidatus Babeliaceae bacterium]